MDELKWHGSWWIPGAPEDPQTGILTVAANGEPTLELIGGFDLSEKTPLDEPGSYSVSIDNKPLPLVHGESEGKRITLVNCHTTFSRGGGFGFGRPNVHKLHAQRALIGVHLSAADEAAFRGAHFRLENFSTWLQMDTLGYSIRRGENAVATAQITQQPPIQCLIDGWALRASMQTRNFELISTRQELSLKGDVTAVLTAEPDSPTRFSAFDEIGISFMDLLTLACGEPCGVISTTLVLVEPLRLEVAKGVWVELEDLVETYGRRIHAAKPQEPAQEVRNFLFTCRDLPFDKIVATWLPLRQSARAACSVLLGIQYSRPGFSEMRLLQTAIAAEALHGAIYGDVTDMSDDEFTALRDSILNRIDEKHQREWVKRNLRNAPSLRARLLELAAAPSSKAVDSFIPDRQAWAKRLADARNGLAHSGNAKSAANIFDLAEISLLLLRLYLMDAIGLSHAVQERAIASNGYLMTRP